VSTLDRVRPAFVERIHPSWISGAPPPVGMAEDVRRWIERGRLGRLADMPGGECAEAAAPEDLARIDADELRRLIEVIGRKKLALVAQAAPSGAARLLAAQLGGDAAAFIAEVAAKAPKEEVSAAVRRLAQVARKPPLLVRAGAAWIGPWLASRGGSFERVIAQRLPKELGLMLMDGGPFDGRDLWPEVHAAALSMRRRR
jgi:hypothetical protein